MAVRETIGVGFVGAGWMARTHAHALHTINHLAPLPKRARLVAISGLDVPGTGPGGVAEPVAVAAAKLGFERSTTRWEEVVEDPDVDVIANVTPNDLHAAPSIAALELGKPVLCEKPLARDAAEARQVAAAAEAAGVPTCCDYNYRLVPAVQLARQVAASGRLGTLRHVRGLYLQDWAGSADVARSWRFDRSQSGSGVVGDFSHIVDLLRHLAGEPRSVTAHVTRFIDERRSPASGELLPVENEDAFAAVLELEDGALATLEGSRCATGRKARGWIELNGSEGSLWWNLEDLNRLHAFFVEDERSGAGGFRDVLVTEPEHPFQEHWWAPGAILGWGDIFVHQWLEFLNAVLEERPAPARQASFADGYRAMVICDAILESAAEGRRVAIDR